MTGEIENKPAINLLLYGEPKVGKSTFAASSPSPLICDAESGYRYMSSKGINIPVAEIIQWSDMKDFYTEASKPKYKTIVIDPVNELLDKLITSAKANKMYIQNTDPNALSMKGWGYVKDKMKQMLKSFRDLNKNVIFVAHLKEKEEDGQIKKTPKLDANLTSELMAMMDIIGYMFILNDGKEQKRVISFKPSIRFDAGDRTSALPEFFNPNDGFDKLYETVTSSKAFVYKKKLDKGIKENEDKFLADMGIESETNMEDIKPEELPL